MNLCCRRRAAVLPPPLQEPWNGDFEVVGEDDHYEDIAAMEGWRLLMCRLYRRGLIDLPQGPELVDDVAAIDGWRRMMMRFHRLFFKRRCNAFLGMHLRRYSELSIPQRPTETEPAMGGGGS